MGDSHHQAATSSRLGIRQSGGEIVEVQGGHIVRSTGRKDRHSKVCTAKGPRDRRVRLSAHTAIQFYDVQDRLGYDRPSKAVDWLIKKAKTAIDELAELPPWNPETLTAATSITKSTNQVDQNTTTATDNDKPYDFHIHHGGNLVENLATGSSTRRRTATIMGNEVQSLQQQEMGDNPNNNSGFLPPSLVSDEIADTIKSFFPLGASSETPSSSIQFQNYPPDLLSRTSSHSQDLRLSLQSFPEPILFSDRHIGRGGSSHYSSSEYGPSHGKPAQKRENGTHAFAGSSSSGSGMQGNNLNWRPPPHSEVMVTEHKMSTVGLGDGISSSSQPTGYQSAWLGVPGQVSMADIVKMGRPQSKASAMPNPSLQSINNRHLVVPTATLPPNLQGPASKVSDVNYEPDVTKHDSPSDEWPPIENPSGASVTSVLEAPAESGLYANASNLPLGRSSQQLKSQLEEAQAVDDDPIETVNGNHVRSPSISSRNILEDDSGGSSLYDNDLYKDINSYQPQRHAFEHDEAEDGSSSVAVNLQQLNLHDEDREPLTEEDNPSVIIPNHLQVHTPDCSHLSFGSFGPGIGSAFSGPFASRPSKNNLDEVLEAVDAASVGHSDNRNPEYYGDEHLRSNMEGDIMNRSNVGTGNYEAPEGSGPEVLKQDASEAAQGSQYTFPSSASGYNYENSQQLNPAFTHMQTSSQMQSLTPFPSVMQAYTNSLPSTLLTSTVQSAREPDLPYSPFPMTQSMPTKYSNAASSISGPTISMPEALRAASISATQPTPQSLPGASVATGPALPQHLAMHPFSQPTLPLGHFANMISYPFLPQSYTYMPSAFQQAFAGNSNYPQSLAAVHPQYKNSVSVSSLPQSATIPSGYSFGSSTSIPGGLPLNPPTAPAGTTIGYDDVLSSQYKDINHLMSLQQNENSAMWFHGPGSRTMSAVPASTYYSFQGQNQQAGGFRQGQQPSQHFGALGYPNFYHSQTGVLLDHQQQNPRDGSLSGSQGHQPSKQTQQLWQNNY